MSSERGPAVDPDLPLASAALREADHRVDPVRRDDPDVDRARYDLCVVRSCWDCAWRSEEFLGWAGRVGRLRNAVEVLRWNTDETCVRDLQAHGPSGGWRPSCRGHWSHRPRVHPASGRP